MHAQGLDEVRPRIEATDSDLTRSLPIHHFDALHVPFIALLALQDGRGNRVSNIYIAL